MRQLIPCYVVLYLALSVQGLSQTYRLPERGLCAHRGAMTSHPENTLPAFYEAIRVGAHMIELDVQFSKDSALIIMHDATVERTTNGMGKVAEMTLEEIKGLDAGSWKEAAFQGTRVPVLKEVLDIMPRDIWLNIHIKGGKEVGRQVAMIVMESDRTHQAILAVGEQARRGAQEVSADILICNMERQSGKWDYVESTMAMPADFIQLRGSVTEDYPEYIKALKEAGVRVNYFGSDDPVELTRLWEMGVDFPLVNDILPAMLVGEAIGILPVNRD